MATQDTDVEIIETGEEELTWEIAIQTIRQATEISQVLHSLVQDDDFRDISPEDMQRLQRDIWSFTAASLKWELSWPLERYNLEEFDTDYESGLDMYEFQNYVNALNFSIQAIVELDGKGEFESIVEEAYDMSTGEYQEWIQWWAREKIQDIRNGIWDISDIDSAYLNEIKNQNFDFPWGFFSSEFWIVLGAEWGAIIEDVVDLVVSIIPAMWRIPHYLELREMRSFWDHLQGASADVQIAELVYHNPIFWLGEISLEDLEELWRLLISGTNEWVVLWLTSAVWLLAGWVWIAKLGSRVMRRNVTPHIQRIEPTLEKPQRTDGIMGTWEPTPDLKAMSSEYRINISGENLDNMNIWERIRIAEEAFWRQFNAGELQLIGKINAMPGNRHIKINAFLDEIQESWNTNIFPDTLEIQSLFDARIINYD